MYLLTLPYAVALKPKYSVIAKGDAWIVYPWENKESEEIQDYKK